MLNKKTWMVALILLIVVVSTASVVLAVTYDVGPDGKYSDTVDNTYVIKGVDKTNSESIELKGFTATPTRAQPDSVQLYDGIDIASDYTGISGHDISNENLNKIKEVIVKNYKYYNSPADNLIIQYVIWELVSPGYISTLSGQQQLAAQWMYENLGNLRVSGDAHSWDGGAYTHDFTFYLGTPTGGETPEAVSQIFLFTYDYIKNPNNHNPSGGENDYVDPTKVNPESDDAHLDDDDFINGTNNPENDDESSAEGNGANASMKNTGVPLIATLIAIFAIVGHYIKRD
ncbi:MAG: hypothetical protein FWE58_00370 [Methanobrevibacter sp.]|nr:hypothetical protein [Methanobrevibacter sp.]